MYANPYIIQISLVLNGSQMGPSRSSSHRSIEKIHADKGSVLIIRQGHGDTAKMHSYLTCLPVDLSITHTEVSTDLEKKKLTGWNSFIAMEKLVKQIYL